MVVRLLPIVGRKNEVSPSTSSFGFPDFPEVLFPDVMPDLGRANLSTEGCEELESSLAKDSGELEPFPVELKAYYTYSSKTRNGHQKGFYIDIGILIENFAFRDLTKINYAIKKQSRLFCAITWPIFSTIQASRSSACSSL